MLQPTEIYKHFEEFAQASACAKEAARILATSTAVRWHVIDWVVLVPTGAGAHLRAYAGRAPQSDYEDISNDSGLFRDDMSSDQDDWDVPKKKDGTTAMTIRYARPARRRLGMLRRHYCALAQCDRRPLKV